MENNKAVLFELNIENDRCIFPNTISDAIIDANKELKDLEDKLNETLETIRLLTPECDKLDYILSASSGALCGIIDVFLVGKPGESPLGDIQRSKANNEAIFMKREKVIIDDYMEGLKILSKTYDDKLLMTFVSDFKSSNAYKESFNKSVELAKLRNVPENERIKSKADIDCYFRGGSLK